MLTKNYVAPNGAVTNYHAIKSLSASLPGDFMDVIAQSFATQADLVMGKAPVWSSSPISIPIASIGAPLIGSIEAWLASNAASPFAGASVSQLVGVDLEAAKLRQWATVKAARDRAVYAGFVWSGKPFDSDLQSQIFIEGAAQLALLAQMASQAFSIDFTLQDNTVATLSGADMLSVGQAMGVHIMTQHGIGRGLRTTIEAALTVNAVLAAVWPA